MAQITRYDGNIKPFADDALGTERTIFGAETQDDTLDANINADFLRGWGIVGVNGLPTKQDFNAFAYTSTALSSYIYQMGIPEWNTSQEFFIGSITNEGGTIYKCVLANTGEQPSLDDGTYWEEVGAGFSISDLTEESIADGDFIPFQDVSDGGNPKKILKSDLVQFSKVYNSGDQNITAGTTLTLTHGFSSQPKMVLPFLKCTGAENGFAVGDILPIAFTNYDQNAANNRGLSCYFENATEMKIMFGGSGGSAFEYLNTSRVNVAFLDANWDIILVAYR